MIFFFFYYYEFVFFLLGTSSLLNALVAPRGPDRRHISGAVSLFLIKQLVVNSKKIGGSAAGQTKRIEKKQKLACFL